MFGRLRIEGFAHVLVEAAARAEVDMDVDQPGQHRLARRFDWLRIQALRIRRRAFVDFRDLSLRTRIAPDSITRPSPTKIRAF